MMKEIIFTPHTATPLCGSHSPFCLLLSYLGHVADYDGHDDPIDCYSFTEDNAGETQKNSERCFKLKALSSHEKLQLWTNSNKLCPWLIGEAVIHWLPGYRVAKESRAQGYVYT